MKSSKFNIKNWVKVKNNPNIIDEIVALNACLGSYIYQLEYANNRHWRQEDELEICSVILNEKEKE